MAVIDISHQIVQQTAATKSGWLRAAPRWLITQHRCLIDDEEGVLPKGTYQAGMLYKDTTSRTRVMNWGTKTMDVI
jgi:hypothetical protein